MRRILRNRRLGSKAESPPNSPLLNPFDASLPIGIARSMSQRTELDGSNEYWSKKNELPMLSSIAGSQDSRSKDAVEIDGREWDGFSGEHGPVSPLPPAVTREREKDGLGGFKLFPTRSKRESVGANF